ncbi:hypothetical protein DWB68_10885 [Galactobacter valiniphilus]|uniref:Uncharacterized protein n=1 Tax=Galactobacter valiniphilus TaxID=2676122 RepID=A0A399J9M9_9MICC|nr:hypothetical protein [Galactobacter valiniphilus]RII41780.1 hypothetical protein DWB68_10885 [Galactobacter valiniphilus]
MSLENQGTDAGQGMTPDAGPGTVWRVTLAWPETSTTGRQERVDGLQQLLSTRAVVGLMGPGRPTRGGMVVDLVLPVEQTRILTASRDGQLNAGAVGDDFAWELHRFTGAVVVNGDLATGDFAVLASDGSLDDDALAGLLDEPVSEALLIGTVPAAEAEESADRLEVAGWISDGERPVVAAIAPEADPTALLLPGSSELSLALRERPGRVDVLLWGAPEASPAAQPTRRRRAAHRTPLLSTHLGARRRAVVLPDFMRPAGSDAAALLERLEEDFAPVSSQEMTALGRVLPASALRDLVSAINDAPALGLDPEGGVLAPVEDGLMPGEEQDVEQPSPHAQAAAVLRALGQDPAWLGLFDGVAPVGRSARPLAGREPARPLVRRLEEPARTLPAAPAAPAASTTQAEAPTRVSPSVEPAVPAKAPSPQVFDAVAAPAVGLPLPSQAGDREAAARLGVGTQAGGFASRVRRAAGATEEGTFEEVLTGVATGALPAAVQAGTPLPTPAAGTPTSSAGDDSAALRRGGWAVPVLVIGVILLVLGIVAFVFSDRFTEIKDLLRLGAAVSAGLGVVLGIVSLFGARR